MRRAFWGYSLKGFLGIFRGGGGGESHALGVGDTLWGGNLFTSPDTSKEFAIISNLRLERRQVIINCPVNFKN
jgi:hypothetical protein